MTSGHNSELRLVFMVIVAFNWLWEDGRYIFEHEVGRKQTGSSTNLAICCKDNPVTLSE